MRYYKGYIAVSDTCDIPVLLQIRNSRAICFDQLQDLLSHEMLAVLSRSLRWRVNRTQFYEEWFSSLAAQVRFLKHTLRFPCYGDPEYTFSDVEMAIQREIVNRNYLARYELRLAEEQQATDLALLKQLERKYRTGEENGDRSPQPAIPPVDRTPDTPLQGSLF